MKVNLTVQDDGPGFVEGDEKRVFELFYRGATASRRAAGAGIGLYVVGALRPGHVRAGVGADASRGGGEVGVTLYVVDTMP